MIAEYKKNANLGVGLGLLLQFGGAVVAGDPIGKLMLLGGLASFLWGCGNYAMAKGYTGWLWLLGLLQLLGLIVLAIMPDRAKGEGAATTSAGNAVRPMLGVAAVLGLAALAWFVVIPGYLDYTARSASKDAAKKIDYSSIPVRINYRKAVLGQYANDTPLRFEGEAFQVLSQQRLALVRTKWEKAFGGGYVGNNVLLEFSDRPLMVAGDVVEVSGRYIGTQQYKSLTGIQEVPLVYVDRYHINQ